ncbi:MAG: PqqD family protein [Zymomonas sp.]|nr:MAG: PqqD family protein [Zymomonas sp.]
MAIEMQRDIQFDQTSARFVAHKDAVACDIGNEKALLNLDSGTYFTLNPSASLIWNRLQEPRTQQELCVALSDEYEIGPEACAADVGVILADLKTAGLIVDVDA